MTGPAEIVEWLRDVHDTIERTVNAVGGGRWQVDDARALDRVYAERLLLEEHAPEWRTVEWPHDQNGNGEALVCRRCQNAEYTEWHPEVGQAGVLPDGFVAPYVLAPCTTVRLLASGYASWPGYQERWKP